MTDLTVSESPSSVTGFFMKRGGWPRPPLVLALVLGNIMENAFVISTRAYDGWLWLTRPMFLVIMGLVVVTILLSARSRMKKRGDKTDEAVEGHAFNPIVSLPIAALMVVCFAAAIVGALDWVRTARIFPLAAAIPGVLMATALVFWESRALVTQAGQLGGLAAVARLTAERTNLSRGFQFVGCLIGLVFLMLLLGHKIALPLFIAIYIVRWGGFSWRVAAVYAPASWAFMLVFYDRVLHVFWYRSVLYHALVEVLPDRFPQWLIM